MAQQQNRADGISEKSERTSEGDFEREHTEEDDIKQPDPAETQPNNNGRQSRISNQVVNPESTERVSEQLANFEERKVDNSDPSQNASQHQYENSNSAALNIDRSPVDGNDNDQNNLREIIRRE